MRLIDADAFRKWLYTLFAGHGTHEDDTKDEEEWNANLAQIITHLDQQPTVKAKRMNDMAKEAIKEIREMCWGYDIPSPCCPEYREHHEQMQELLKVCDKWLKKLEEGNEDCIYIGKDKYVRDADGQGWHVVEGGEKK